MLYDVIAKTQFFSPPYLTVITVINVPLKHTFLIEFDVIDWSEKSRLISLKMEEKFQEDETRDSTTRSCLPVVKHIHEYLHERKHKKQKQCGQNSKSDMYVIIDK